MDSKNQSITDKVKESADFIRQKSPMAPATGIILGTGLGELAREIDITTTIDYEEIPHFPLSTVEFHKGKLIFGKLSGKEVVAMQGRFHYYEGYTMQEVTFPVRVLKYLGVEKLIISNACGSVNPYIRAKDIMIIDDHINLLGGNPLIGVNDESTGPRFPDMSQPYSPALIAVCEQAALENSMKVHKGVYAAMTGPSFETRAEYRFLRTIGADVVGMSTIPEVIVANQISLEVLGLSIVTDECYPDALEKVNIDIVLANAAKAEAALTKLVKSVVAKI